MSVMGIGERIKERRKELGISADELAAKIGKSRVTVFRYENGDIQNMPIDTLRPIAEVLHTTPAYLMGWSQEVIDEQTVIIKDKNEYFDKYEAEFKEFMDELFELSLTSDELNEVSNYAKYIKSKRKE